MNQMTPAPSCGCCEGIEILTPMPTANRPGLDALAYRVGTHASFLETMKARLSTLYLEMPSPSADQDSQRKYPLRDLTTRDGADPSIAMLDAWATVADVLTFYQERLANEGYLRTATQRRSILELARLVGYRLRPGVAASVYLAFELVADGDPVEIPAGTRAQSLPGPDELPQSFETSEPLPARVEWNAIRPRLSKPQLITESTDTVHLKGIDTNLKPNDPLVVIDSNGDKRFRRVLRVETDAAADRTKVILKLEGDIGLYVDNLELLIQPERVPEEEGPYSIAIGERMANETQQSMAGLVQLLRAPDYPRNTLVYVIETEIPRLDQSIRIIRALNFDVLAEWLERVRRQVDIILNQLRLRPASEEHEVHPEKLDLEELKVLVDQNRTSGKPFGKEIGAFELNAAKTSLRALIELYENPQSSDVEKELARQRLARRADQLRYVFEELGFATLLDWARRLYTALTPEIAEEPSPPPEMETPISPIGLLVGLVAPLVKAPLLPPPSPLQLTRSVGQLYLPQTDMKSKLLTTLLPALSDTLFVAQRNLVTEPGLAKVYALRTSAALFGHNVPRQVDYDGNNTPTLPEDWPEWTRAPDEARDVLYLDAAYEEITTGSYVAVKRADSSAKVFEVIEVIIRPRTAYGLSMKTTEIRLPLDEHPDGWWNPDVECQSTPEGDPECFQIIRGTTVYAQSELLELAEEPFETDIGGSEIELDDLYDGLETGRWLVITGERTDVPGTSGVEGRDLAMLAGVEEDFDPALPGDRTHTRLLLANDLTYTYRRDTVTVYANVAKATHGETRQEVLGSGDAGKARQRFDLKQSPLTYTAAPTPAGAESTLKVYVNDVRWHEAESQVALSPGDRKYITQTDNEGKTTVVFGDGQRGARPPTGSENIRATYRSGIGQPGNVAADQISLLVSRPLGVKGVINPRRASGGADPETRDQARRNAPLAVMALDRLVSVQDYADFARTFAGIGKASAVCLSDGLRQVVHVTIAGANDIPIDPESDLYRNLVLALRQHGDPHQPIEVEVRELLVLVINARVRLLPDHVWEVVARQIRDALLDALGFERRELGQDVLQSEILSVIQRVPGVAYVDLDVLDSVSETEAQDEALLSDKLEKLTGGGAGGPKKGSRARIPVKMAEPDDGNGIAPAQLAFLSPDLQDTLILTEIS